MPDEARGDIWRGLGLVALLHALIPGASFALTWLAPHVEILLMPSLLFVAFIGLGQFVYIGPALAYAWRRGRPGIVQGLIIGAALTFLLNSACFGYVLLGGVRLAG